MIYGHALPDQMHAEYFVAVYGDLVYQYMTINRKMCVEGSGSGTEEKTILSIGDRMAGSLVVSRFSGRPCTAAYVLHPSLAVTW